MRRPPAVMRYPRHHLRRVTAHISRPGLNDEHLFLGLGEIFRIGSRKDKFAVGIWIPYGCNGGMALNGWVTPLLGHISGSTDILMTLRVD